MESEIIPFLKGLSNLKGYQDALKVKDNINNLTRP
jgi:hypothetical protein